MRLLVFVSALALLAAPARLEVSSSAGRVTVRANGVPLSDVLEELGRKTGMEVVFESAPPRQPVTANIQGLPEEEAIAKLLEGQRLSWGVKLSANQKRVERLVIADPARAGSRKQGQEKPAPEGREAVPEPEMPASASYPAPRRTPPPTPRPSPTASPSPSPSPTASPRPRPSPTATPRPLLNPTPAPSPTPRPSPTASPRPSPSPTPSPSATPTRRPTPPPSQTQG